MLFALRLILLLLSASAAAQVQTEVLVIGGGTGGTAAAIQSARSGARTLLVEPTPMLAGMLTAAGVSCTDGNHDLTSGLWQEFREALYQHYGTRNLASGWVSHTCFEPSAADSILKAMARKEPLLQVRYGWYFSSVLKTGDKVTGAVFSNANNQEMRVMAAVTIDATELGDVFAAAGATFYLGMDSPQLTGEQEAKEKNNIIQDLTWAAVLKDYGAGADRTIEKPEGYDPAKYYCSCQEAPCPKGKPWNGTVQKMLDYARLTTKDGSLKYMLNWPIHGNDTYLDVVAMTEVQRIKAYGKAKNQTLGFIYFLQTTLGKKHIGLADDELDGGMALIPYHREGRRVKGIRFLALQHMRHPYNYSLYKEGISVGNYPVDHHHGQYPGVVPELEFPPVPAFNIPLGALIPEKVKGLVVCEKGISVSNLVNGSTRLQPVVLLTGQAAGILAAQAARQKTEPAQVKVRAVQQALLDAGAYLMPFTDVAAADPHWAAIQRIGITGILKGRGKPEAWANKMLFNPDSLVAYNELLKGLQEIAVFKKHLQQVQLKKDTTGLTIAGLVDLLQPVKQYVDTPYEADGLQMKSRIQKLVQQQFGFELLNDQKLNRRQVAFLVDQLLQPFLK